MALAIPAWMPWGVLKGLSVFISLLLLFIGLDLMLGGKLVKGLSRFMNKRVDLDNHVIASLNNLRRGADREVQLDHTLLDTGIRVAVSVFLLIASAMIFFMIAMRMR